MPVARCKWPVLLTLASLSLGVSASGSVPAASLPQQAQHWQSPAEVASIKELLEARISLQERISNAPPRASKGILIPAGGREQLLNCAAAVVLIREYFCSKLPIEVFYNGPAEYYAPAIALIQSYEGARCADASKFAQPFHHKPVQLESFGFKVFSLYKSSFDRVLLLDADNMPFIKPDRLLEDENFTKSGNRFWPDYTQREGWYVVAPEAYEIFGLRPPWLDNDDWTSSESGQILLDRRRHADVLEWAWFLQTNFDSLTDKLWGDKDLFELAFHLANKSAEFSQVSMPPRAAVHREPKGEWLQLAMVQSMDNGELAFLHRTAMGAKAGRDGEDNPIRRWWPHFLTTPITRHIGSRIISFNFDFRLVALDSGAFDTGNFTCTSHPDGPPSLSDAAFKGNDKLGLGASTTGKTRNFMSSLRKGRSRQRSPSPSPRELIAYDADLSETLAFSLDDSSPDVARTEARFETICPWDGSLSISKIDFSVDNGMYTAVEVVKAFEQAFDRVLRHVESQEAMSTP